MSLPRRVLRYACDGTPLTRLRARTGAGMQLFGHRGASAACAENTRASFEAALRGGATGVECDVRLLNDGRVVVLHDPTLRRTAAVPPNARHAAVLDVDVAQLSWAEVKEVDVGAYYGDAFAGQRVLLVEEFFELITQHRCAALVELKGTSRALVEAAASAAEAAIESGLAADTIHWISFDRGVLAAMKRRLPRCPAYLIAAVPDVLRPGWPGQLAGEGGCRTVVDTASAAGLDGVDLAAVPEVVTPAVIAHAHSKGLQVGVWVSPLLQQRLDRVLDCEENWATFADRGARFFTSDLPPPVWTWWRRCRQKL